MAHPKGEYEGHKNWTHWNVSLWINNDYPTYRRAMDFATGPRTLANAARLFREELGERTPDGARFSLVAVREALKDLREEHAIYLASQNKTP